MYMVDNAILCRSRAASASFQYTANEALQRRARCQDINPLEHIWDITKRQVQKIESSAQTVDEVKAAIHHVMNGNILRF